MGKRSKKKRPDRGGSATGGTAGMNTDILPIGMMHSLAARHWKSWFDTAVPMLDDRTPREAALSQEGRDKIDNLLVFYDSMRGGSSIDVNIPSDYARWKLGYGPGSADQFVEQEAILNHREEGERPTQRKERHTNRLEKKKVTIFIPRRCELPGCTKKGVDNVRGCSRCYCSYYCCKEHLVEDWARHKLDCKFLSKMDADINPRPFLSSDELQKYPLGWFPVSQKDDNAKCFICHSKQSEVNIAYTPCCNLPVCDNSHEYVTCSYSRDFCMRSHIMYTKCNTHFEEGHKGDWRECEECNKPQNGARPYASTNGFCATPCLEQFLPQGSMITYACDVPFCKSRILPGHSSTSFKDGMTMCQTCSGSDGTRGHTIHF